jgi:hypothetical protein
VICDIVTLVQVIVCTIQRTQNNVPYKHGNGSRSRVNTVHYFEYVVLYTQSLVLMLQYHISPTKHSTVPVFIRYIILCSLYCTHNHFLTLVQVIVCAIQRTQNNVPYKHGNGRMFGC